MKFFVMLTILSGSLFSTISNAADVCEYSTANLKSSSGLPDFPHFRVAHHTGNDFDWLPDFAKAATIVVDTRLVNDLGGKDNRIDWSVLKSAIQPGTEDILLIKEHVTIRYDEISDTPLKAIAVQGTLEFASNRSTRLTVGTLFIDGGPGRPAAGRLLIDTPDPRYLTDIVFAGEVDINQDPGQFSVGLVATGGEINIRGADIRGHRGKIIMGADAGSALFKLDSAFGFESVSDFTAVAGRPPQYVYLSDAQSGLSDVLNCPDNGMFGQNCAFQQQGEFIRIKNLTDKNLAGKITTTVELSERLSYSHKNTYAAFLTRNVIFRSKNPAVLMQRGHVLFTGSARVNLHGAAFENLGRTTTALLNDTRYSENGEVLVTGRNQRGRYLLHFHHTHQPFAVQAVSIYNDPAIVLDHDIKWGFVHHASHGTLTDSVCVGEIGACFVAEAGNETGTWQGNLAIGTGGGSLVLNPHERRNCRISEQSTQKLEDHGHAGYGYWLRGPMLALGGENPDDGNIAAGVFGISFSYDIPLKSKREWVQVPHLGKLTGLENPDKNRCASAATATDYYRDCVLANATDKQWIPISRITNHLFQNNVAVGTTLRGALLEIWHAYPRESERYRIKNSLLVLKGRTNLANTNLALFSPYSSIEVSDSRLLSMATRSGLSGKYRTTGIDTKSAVRTRMRVIDSDIKGFSTGLNVPPAGGEFYRLNLKNEVNISVGKMAELFLKPLDDGSLPWARLVKIDDVNFHSLYADKPTQHHLQMARGNIKYADYRFLHNLQPVMTIITNSRLCNETACSAAEKLPSCQDQEPPVVSCTIEKMYVYDKQQAPNYPNDWQPVNDSHHRSDARLAGRFSKTSRKDWGIKEFNQAESNTPVTISDFSNQQLWDTFHVARGGMLMPCSPSQPEGDCFYNDGKNHIQYGKDYGIDGYIDSQPPGKPVIILWSDDIIKGNKYSLTYKVCNDDDGDGYLECGDLRKVSAQDEDIYLCRYNQQGHIVGGQCQWRGQAAVEDVPADEFYLDEAGLYSVTANIALAENKEIQKVFFFSRLE